MEILITISEGLSKETMDGLTNVERAQIERVLLERSGDECIPIPSDLEARVFKRAEEINAQVNG